MSFPLWAVRPVDCFLHLTDSLFCIQDLQRQQCGGTVFLGLCFHVWQDNRMQCMVLLERQLIYYHYMVCPCLVIHLHAAPPRRHCMPVILFLWHADHLEARIRTVLSSALKVMGFLCFWLHACSKQFFKSLSSVNLAFLTGSWDSEQLFFLKFLWTFGLERQALRLILLQKGTTDPISGTGRVTRRTIQDVCPGQK